MDIKLKDQIEQNLIDIIGEINKLYDDMDDDLQIHMVGMVYAIDEWLKNETEKNLDDFFDITFACGIALTQEIDKKWRRLTRLILKIRCNLIIYIFIKISKKILKGWFT